MPGPHSTTNEIEDFIASVTEELKGPMSDLDRALLVEDRKEAREELARRRAATETQH